MAFTDSLADLSEHAVEDWLRALQAEFGGIAAGLWRTQGVYLCNLGQVFTAAVPPDVAESFRQATTKVGLSRADLGIVRAAIDRAPTAVTLGEGPDGSRGWIGRFGARFSFAVPIMAGSRVLGVVAIALPDIPTDLQAFHSDMAQIAMTIARPLAAKT